jgi:signal transduction histidine kinase
LFLQYQIISSVLVVLFLVTFFVVEGKISMLVVSMIFTLIIIYGYFFNKSTEKIVEANFSQTKAKEALAELTKNLKQKVAEQTRDITKKNDDLQKNNKELEAKNQLNQELLAMKSDFLRVVNHQLNTPISIMRGYFSMIKEGDYKPEKALPAVEAGLNRINQVVADFLDAYELEGERMKMKPERLDITIVVDKMVGEKKELQCAKERKLEISVEKPSFEIPSVWCDIKRITDVVSNLLDNAVFYTYKGKIIISYELAGDYLRINVKDTGSGITEEDKKKLFQKFTRGTGASGMHPDGSGLGLYIIKKIMEGSGGEVSFVSDGAGKGTVFSFTVPVYSNQQAGNMSDATTRENKIEIFN